MIKVGIVGGAGYTAGELIRMLLAHPEAKIEFVYSTSNAGNKLYKVHSDLLGETEMEFVGQISPVDVIFLCLGHGLSADFLSAHALPASTKVIDLGNDFRLESKYKGREFVYGLPEVHRKQIQQASNIANPGCFATAIQLALLPLAKAGMLQNEIHVNAITGSTGAGRSLSETGHFSYRNNNIAIYKPFTHQHLGEIAKTLNAIQQSGEVDMNFIPVRGNFARGIFASVYTKCTLNKEEAAHLYKEYYQDEPFTFVSAAGVSLKEVVNTNKCFLHIDVIKGNILISSIIDNLVKGASGQAIQNMNLMFGLSEDCGLRLKPSAF